MEKENTATNLESKDLNPNNIQDFPAETEKNRLADTEARELILKFWKTDLKINFDFLLKFYYEIVKEIFFILFY